jgi:hypothetical protein
VQSIARDLKIEGNGEWLVSDFQNASVDTLWEHQALANDRVSLQWGASLHYIACAAKGADVVQRPDYLSDRSVQLVSEYGDELDSGEPFVVGVFKSDDVPADEPDWLESDALQIKSLSAEIIAFVEYDGCISGAPYEIAMGAERPFFKIRETSTRELVKCFYAQSLHSSVYAAMRDKNSLIYVYGSLQQNQLTGLFGDVVARLVEPAPHFTPEDFEKLLGSAPNLSGRLNSETYVAKIRGNG